MGHTGMKVEDIVENTLAVAKVLDEKLPMVPHMFLSFNFLYCNSTVHSIWQYRAFPITNDVRKINAIRKH